MSDQQWIDLWRRLRDEHAILAAMSGNLDLSLGHKFPGLLARRHLRIAARADMRACEATRRSNARHRAIRAAHDKWQEEFCRSMAEADAEEQDELDRLEWWLEQRAEEARDR